MSSSRLLLLSSTVVYGSGILEWCADIVKSFFARQGAKNILFIPYAMKDYDKYADKMSKAWEKLGFSLESIHKKDDPIKAVQEAEGIYIGGGNTFLLLKTLCDNNLIEPIREAVIKKGIPFVGSSAGSNVATCSICTTNDMPICYPPTFEALNLVPFNINPHYLEPDPDSKHQGETRDKRIDEYLEQDNCANVVGLKEGSALIIEDGKVVVHGLPAKLFQKGKDPLIYNDGSDLSFLLG